MQREAFCDALSALKSFSAGAAGGAYDAPPDPVVGWGGGPHTSPHSMPAASRSWSSRFILPPDLGVPDETLADSVIEFNDRFRISKGSVLPRCIVCNAVFLIAKLSVCLSVRHTREL